MVITKEQVKKDVIDQLYWDERVDASEVKVEVSDGQVKLEGSVPTFSALRAAENDAIKIPGVVLVDNQLKVEPVPVLPPSSDEEIKTRAETILRWNADIDANNISVSVIAGYVTLNGHVDSYWKKLRAEELVEDLFGVRAVDNALSVVLTPSRSDERIAEDVVSALRRRIDLDINHVDVMVENGVVMLSGTVPNWTVLQEVEVIARYTAGVMEVINDLWVSRTHELK